MSDLTPVLTSASLLREKLHAKTTQALAAAFPLDLKGRTLELQDVRVHAQNYSPTDEYNAITKGSSLYEPVKGTLVLKDASGKVVDEAKNFTLAHVPYLTARHTLIADGNEYQVANQLRRKPGVYTQRSDNGDLKTVFNLGRGKNFDLAFNPDKGTFHMQYGTSNLPLYAVLRGMGVEHDHIAKHLGAGVARANEDEHGHQTATTISKLYTKVEHPAVLNPNAPHETKVEAIKKRFDQATLDPEVTTATLGAAHTSVTPTTLLVAAKKMLDVHAGKTDVDDTDSLKFKTFHTLDDFISERIKLTSRVWAPKARMALTGKNSIREALKPAPFSDPIRKFLTTSSLSSVPTGINPMEIIDHAVKVTSLGEGGIPSDRAIPVDARMIHNTHFGALDPIRTPECHPDTSEVLTMTGWKRWDLVTENDVFACRVNGRLEYHRASRVVRARYKGVLYGVQNSKLEYLVTPNHRVLCAPLDRVYPLTEGSPSKFTLIEAADVHGKPRVFDTGHEPYEGGGADKFVLPDVAGYAPAAPPLPMCIWAAFMGWYLSEGCVSKQKNGEPARVHISQSVSVNEWKCAALERVLRQLPFKWTYRNNSYNISHRQLATYLAQFGFCESKYIPEYFFEADQDSRRNLLEALLLGDGRIDSTRATGKVYEQEVFCTTSSRLADDVERLAISLGRSVRVSKYSDKRQDRYLDVYEVRLMRDRFRQAVPRKGHYYTTFYDGMVYCATVPGGLLYVRHGRGLGHWSGNSNHSGVDIRATIAAHRDDKGNLYTVLRNVKTGKDDYVRAGDLNKYVVAFPHQELRGMVDAFVDGHQTRVAASRVTHQLGHVKHLYSPATSLIPMIHSIQGNRAIMGSKMGTQALPLVEREAPLVQVRSHHPEGHSFEAIYGHMIVPTAPVSGTVAKVDHEFIYLKPHAVKKASDEAVRHIMVTGHSGAGKSTYAKALAARSGLPLYEYDKVPGLAEAMLGNDHETVTRLQRAAVADSLKNLKTPHVLEGTALLAAPELTQGHQVVLMDAPREAILKARLDRMIQSALARGRPADPERRQAKGVAVYDHYEPMVDNFRKLPGVELRTPGYVPTEKEASQLVAVLTEKTAAGDAGLIKVPYYQKFPFPSKTFLDHSVDVKVGDKVEGGQRLAESNYTRNGVLALGKNLRVGYLPYYGYNSNDAVVISQAAAQKLTSEHMYREVFALSGIELNRAKHQMYYGAKYPAASYAKLDDTGVIKKGAKVDPKDLLVAGLMKQSVSGTDAMLGRIGKTLVKPFKDVGLLWDHGVPGEVVDVIRTSGQITVLVKTREAMQVGDKLAGRYGNKGVVAKIVPDHEMLRDEQGNPLDLLLTSAGVVSRINPAQVIETAVSKVADKTGQPIVYDNSAGHNAVKWARDLMKEHGVKDKEHLYDPLLQRTIKGADGKGVLVGKQYIYKLFKSTDTNFAGHGVGPYDLNEQPLKTGGDESAKGLGKMEFDALLAHNARNFLREASTIRGQKNDEYWKAVQTGLPLPAPKPSFAFNKFLGLLEGAGVKVDKRGSKFSLLPMTDKDVVARSTGALEHGATVRAKDLKPETGGLFDPRKTGGPQGTLYAHIDLHEPVPNPVFEEPIRRLLGMTETKFKEALRDKGGAWFREELGRMNVPAKLRELREQLKTAKGPALNDVVKQIKYLETLQKHKLSPGDAYVISKIPVIPPIFRPVQPGVRDPSQLMVADANKLYAQLFDSNKTLKTTAVQSDIGKHRQDLYTKVEELYGTTLPTDPKMQQQKVKGLLATVAGVGTPKGGFFQRKLMRRTQDVSGRGTAVPDPNLGMDEVGIPEPMLWLALDKLIVARLIRKGYPALTAREMVMSKAPAAREAMLEETRERPAIINRAPTLHRGSIVAAYAKPVPGKTIRVSPFTEKGMNLDYDGDTLQVHFPIGASAVDDAKQMTLSNMLLSDQQRNRLMIFPQHEAIIATTLAAKHTTPNGPVRKFKTREDVLAAYRRGELKLSDSIEVENEKRAEAEDLYDGYGEGPELDAPEFALEPDEALQLYPPEMITGEGGESEDPDVRLLD